MKTYNLIVRIPEPCHENWNNMQPDAKGKFCNSCSKSVFDFSTKMDNEIRDILIEYKDQKVCGHFKKSQVDRPLNISINIRDLPKNISMTKAFAIALFLVFGTFLFSCTDNQGQKVNEIEVIDAEEKKLIMGDISFIPPAELISPTATMTGEPIMPFDSVKTIFYDQITVSGGVSYEEVPTQDVPVYEEIIVAAKTDSLIESYIVGQMVMPYIAPIDTTSILPTDSSDSNSFKKIIEEDVFIKETSFGIYPNPSSGEFTVNYDLLKRADVKVYVHNMKGILVKTIVNIANQHEGQYHIPVNVNELPNGIYLVSLINNGKKMTERLVIEW